MKIIARVKTIGICKYFIWNVIAEVNNNAPLIARIRLTSNGKKPGNARGVSRIRKNVHLVIRLG